MKMKWFYKIVMFIGFFLFITSCNKYEPLLPITSETTPTEEKSGALDPDIEGDVSITDPENEEDIVDSNITDPENEEDK